MNYFTKNSIYKSLIFILFFSFLYSCSDTYEDLGASEGLYLADGAFSGDNGSQIGDSIYAGQITAGEWSDLDNWDFWNNLFQNDEFAAYPGAWKFDLTKRIEVRLIDQSGNPVIDKAMSLVDSENNVIWDAKSDFDGYAELFPPLADGGNIADLFLNINGSVYSDLILYSSGTNEITITGAASNPADNTIDIAFVVDATGSMSDELEYLKVELVDVIDSVKEVNAGASINLGSVFYRDEGDDYVTRKSEFNSDISTTISFIEDQEASGGGDFPEAVHSALNVAINQLQWRANVNSRILFLLLDAPPHSSTQVIDQVNTLVKSAAKKGIKIIPITASGIDKSTEFLMRYFSIATNGTYVFITNHSGIGNEHIEPTIGEYDVEYLNELLVRLINRYL